jgi:hypothetical protein
VAVAVLQQRVAMPRMVVGVVSSAGVVVVVVGVLVVARVARAVRSSSLPLCQRLVREEREEREREGRVTAREGRGRQLPRPGWELREVHPVAQGGALHP